MDKIVIIDDEEDIRDILSYNLVKEGFTVFCAPNGQEGIQICKDELPALVILDVMMPGMDGVEVCETLRKTPGLEQVLICFLTARNEEIIDREKYLIYKDGNAIHLPKKEFELLALLASRPDVVFERDYILEKVWGTDIVVGDRTIDVHVRKLREKIGDGHIQTVKGIGYKFKIID